MLELIQTKENSKKAAKIFIMSHGSVLQGFFTKPASITLHDLQDKDFLMRAILSQTYTRFLCDCF